MIEKRPWKLAKFLTLLLTAMLIGIASAAIYYTMNMRQEMTITQPVIIFEQGTDWPAGSSLGTNATYVSLAIKIYPNATLTYDEPLNISNIDSSAHNVRLRHVSITPASASPSVSNFTFINFTLNAIDFDYTTTGDNWNIPSDMSYQSMPASTEWALKIETNAAPGATGALQCVIIIAVDVQE
jgi:hypothetical protein